MIDHNRALVVLGFSETSRRLLEYAGRHAQECDVELILLTIMPTSEFQERDRARLAIPHVEKSYTVGEAEEEGVRHAKRLAREALEGFDVSYEIESHVGRQASLVLERARDRDCSTIFMAGHRNGPWQNTTFDNVMAEVVSAFEGPVTVMMGPERDRDIGNSV
ncbi:universal stress protein [Natronosalvus rutilus]|uniref:Universal stress protein n=1 Tax=Natronosalvus rutilus TaxID=2953753 RepID=A0A9E7NC61_9EURY|nr:universal stress protein [Natronosalvus rutilus]UTF54736.1 universal stress protein [Natronosalvus rutilus]